MSDFCSLEKEFLDVREFLVAIGDEKRQSIIIKLMAEDDCGGLQVTDLIEATSLSRPAVSHHLKILKNAKIIDYRREGTKNFYYFSRELSEVKKLQKLLETITQKVENEATT